MLRLFGIDWRASAMAYGIHERGELGSMTFVLGGQAAADTLVASSGVQPHASKVVEHRGQATTKYLEQLLGQAAISTTGIDDRAQRAIAERQGEKNVVAGASELRLGVHRGDRRAGQIDQQVDHVTHLANQTS